MDKVTQSNAANAEESASAAEELASQAEQLSAAVDQLMVMVQGNQAAGASQPVAKKPQKSISPEVARRPPQTCQGRRRKSIPMDDEGDNFGDFGEARKAA